MVPMQFGGTCSPPAPLGLLDELDTMPSLMSSGKTLLTYWNTVSFFALYAKAADFTLAQSLSPASATMDRWINSELNLLIEKVDQAYANFDSQLAGKLLAAFIDDLSNWYVRRSRRRFWDGETAALSTLYNALKVLTHCLSPMIPFPPNTSGRY
jgi:isoleucyl-tRNA synthetase